MQHIMLSGRLVAPEMEKAAEMTEGYVGKADKNALYDVGKADFLWIYLQIYK